MIGRVTTTCSLKIMEIKKKRHLPKCYIRTRLDLQHDDNPENSCQFQLLKIDHHE